MRCGYWKGRPKTSFNLVFYTYETFVFWMKTHTLQNGHIYLYFAKDFEENPNFLIAHYKIIWSPFPRKYRDLSTLMEMTQNS